MSDFLASDLLYGQDDWLPDDVQKKKEWDPTDPPFSDLLPDTPAKKKKTTKKKTTKKKTTKTRGNMVINPKKPTKKTANTIAKKRAAAKSSTKTTKKTTIKNYLAKTQNKNKSLSPKKPRMPNEDNTGQNFFRVIQMNLHVSTGFHAPSDFDTTIHPFRIVGNKNVELSGISQFATGYQNFKRALKEILIDNVLKVGLYKIRTDKQGLSTTRAATPYINGWIIGQKFGSLNGSSLPKTLVLVTITRNKIKTTPCKINWFYALHFKSTKGDANERTRRAISQNTKAKKIMDALINGPDIDDPNDKDYKGGKPSSKRPLQSRSAAKKQKKSDAQLLKRIQSKANAKAADSAVEKVADAAKTVANAAASVADAATTTVKKAGAKKAGAKKAGAKKTGTRKPRTKRPAVRTHKMTTRSMTKK